MVAEKLMPLARLAGQMVVAAAGTDAWEEAKHGFARLLGCGDPKQTRVAERQLSEAHNQLVKAKGADLEQVRVALMEQWAGRLVDLLQEHPAVESELSALVEEIRAVLPADVVPEGDHAGAAGRSVNISADRGGFAAGIVHGNVTPPAIISPDLAVPRFAGDLESDSAVTDYGETAAAQVVQGPRGVNGEPVRLAPPPSRLAGREELLADLDIWLTDGDGSEPRMVALCGPAGVGKASVAVKYAHRYLAEAEVAWQFAADNPTVLAAGFGELAAHLGARDRDDTRDPVAAVHAVLAKQAPGWLLIFENAADGASIEKFLPPAGHGRVLITSQHQDWPPGQALQVPVLDIEAAAEFLVNHTSDPDRQTAEGLAGELGGLPLALEQAASYIQASGGGLAGYLDSFRQRREELLARDEPTGDSGPIATTWALAFARLEQSAPGAAGLLRLLAFCAPEAVPLRLLLQPRAGLADKLSREVAAVLVPLMEDPAAAGDAIAALSRYSLVLPAAGEAVSVHRLVQAITRGQMPAELEQSWQQAAAAVIEAAIPGDPKQPGTWSDFAALVPHALAALTDGSNGVEQVALYLGHSGSYMASRDLYLEVVEARKKVLGPEHPDTLRARTSLAYWTGRAGDAAGARDQFAALLPIVERVLGPEHPDTLRARDGVAYWTRRRRVVRWASRFFDSEKPYEETDHATREAVESAEEKREAVEHALGKLVTCEPKLTTVVRGYADQKMVIRRFVDGAAARRARGTDAFDYIPVIWTILWSQTVWLIPLLAWWWFSSQYAFWEWVLIGFGAAYSSALMMLVLWRLTPESSPGALTVTRGLIVVAATVAAVVFIVIWHGQRPGGWQVIALGVGVLAIPANIVVMQTRRRLTRAQPDQLQMLALDFVDLLGAIHPAARHGANPPKILVKELEASAKRVLAASERAARHWPWTERQARSQIREFGGSVAAGLRWHKRLVVMPAADASAALFDSFGYGLAAAVASDWQRLMFEPAPSAAQSFWLRYRGRLALAVVLGGLAAATYAFPKVLPSSAEPSLRGLLVLTAVLSLLSPPGETFGHAYEAFGGFYLGTRAAK